MEKIIIEIGNYKVTVNTVAEAQALMGMVKNVKVAPERSADEHVIPIKRKYNKKTKTSHHWTVEQVQYMADHLKVAKLAALTRDEWLTKSHSAGGIQMMGWKLNTNTPKLKLKPELQAIVDRFQDWKDNNN